MAQSVANADAAPDRRRLRILGRGRLFQGRGQHLPRGRKPESADLLRLVGRRFVLLFVAGGFYWLIARRTRILEALLGHPPRWAFRLSAGPHGALYRNLVPRGPIYGRLRDYDNPVAVAFMVGSAILAPVFSFLFIAYPVA